MVPGRTRLTVSEIALLAFGKPHYLSDLRWAGLQTAATRTTPPACAGPGYGIVQKPAPVALYKPRGMAARSFLV